MKNYLHYFFLEIYILLTYKFVNVDSFNWLEFNILEYVESTSEIKLSSFILFSEDSKLTEFLVLIFFLF